MPRRPALFYGWVVVASAFVSHLLSYGTLTVAFGVFFPFMAEALGMSRGVLASATAVARLMSAAIGPVLGPLVDRRGPRPFMGLGVVSLAGGALVLALAEGPWQVFLGYGVVMALGSVALGELTADSTVARWFVRYRSRALAVAVLVLGLAATAVMRRRPEDYGQAPDGDAARFPAGSARLDSGREVSLTARQAARTASFWLLVVSTNLAGLALFGINLHLFSYITDRGLATGIAAGVVTYLYVLHTAAKPVWGLIAERVHVRYCLAACYAGGALGVVLLVLSTSVPALLAFATVYGLTRGAQSFVTSLAWSDYFGRDAQGAIRGLASPFRFVASAAGPVLGGVLYDATGGYGLAFAVFAALFAAGGAMAVAATPPRTARVP